MTEDAEDDGVAAGRIGKAAHGSGSASDFAEGVLDDVGGTNLPPVSLRQGGTSGSAASRTQRPTLETCSSNARASRLTLPWPSARTRCRHRSLSGSLRPAGRPIPSRSTSKARSFSLEAYVALIPYLRQISP